MDSGHVIYLRCNPQIEQHDPKEQVLFRSGIATHLLFVAIATHCHILLHSTLCFHVFEVLVLKEQTTDIILQSQCLNA